MVPSLFFTVLLLLQYLGTFCCEAGTDRELIADKEHAQLKTNERRVRKRVRAERKNVRPRARRKRRRTRRRTRVPKPTSPSSSEPLQTRKRSPAPTEKKQLPRTPQNNSRNRKVPASNRVIPSLPKRSRHQGFQITLVNMGNNTEFDDAIRRAAARWERVIKGDLPNVRKQNDPNFSWFGRRFPGAKNYNEPVDDVVIGYSFQKIDGPGKVLGKAGPMHSRGKGQLGNYSTISGTMIFDSEDLSRSKRNTDAILLHELGHCLGLGGINRRFCAPRCRPSQSKSGLATNTEYDSTKCPHAGRQAKRMGLIRFPEELHMEPKGGIGSACGHFEDLAPASSHWSDLMSSTFNARKAQLLTRMDIGALLDLGGYPKVRLAAADEPRTQRLLRTGLDNNVPTALVTDTSFILHHSETNDPEALIYMEDI